jgi:hypothetical protein
MYSGGNAVTIAPPAGWTLAVRTDNGAVSGMAVYWGLGSATFGAWSFGLTLGGAALAFALGYIGTDNTTPMDVAALGQANASNALATAPSLNTVTADAWLVGFFGWYDGLGGPAPTWSLEFGTFRQSGSLVGASLPDSVAADSADAAQAVPGPSGTKTATASIAMPNIGILVALRPVVAAPAAVAIPYQRTQTYIESPIYFRPEAKVVVPPAVVAPVAVPWTPRTPYDAPTSFRQPPRPIVLAPAAAPLDVAVPWTPRTWYDVAASFWQPPSLIAAVLAAIPPVVAPTAPAPYAPLQIVFQDARIWIIPPSYVVQPPAAAVSQVLVPLASQNPVYIDSPIRPVLQSFAPPKPPAVVVVAAAGSDIIYLVHSGRIAKRISAFVYMEVT